MPKFIDLTNQQFGMWKVIEYAGNSKWLCECRCENKTRREVLGKTLRNGTSKSCGCINKVSIENKIFGDYNNELIQFNVSETDENLSDDLDISGIFKDDEADYDGIFCIQGD